MEFLKKNTFCFRLLHLFLMFFPSIRQIESKVVLHRERKKLYAEICGGRGTWVPVSSVTDRPAGSEGRRHDQPLSAAARRDESPRGLHDPLNAVTKSFYQPLSPAPASDVDCQNISIIDSHELTIPLWNYFVTPTETAAINYILFLDKKRGLLRGLLLSMVFSQS